MSCCFYIDVIECNSAQSTFPEALVLEVFFPFIFPHRDLKKKYLYTFYLNCCLNHSCYINFTVYLVSKSILCGQIDKQHWESTNWERTVALLYFSV